MKHYQEFQNRKLKSEFTHVLMFVFIDCFGVFGGGGGKPDSSKVKRVREIITF